MNRPFRQPPYGDLLGYAHELYGAARNGIAERYTDLSDRTKAEVKLPAE